METEYYPWGGEFTACNNKSCVAVVLLNIDYVPPDTVALYGPLKTENIGIEKIVANVISNPHIRYLAVCGDDIHGHRSGASLIALQKNGIDVQHKIIDAPGAIPYIENLSEAAIQRFCAQIETIDLIGEQDKDKITKVIDKLIANQPPHFGKPYLAIRITPEVTVSLEDKRALHANIVMNYLGKIEKRGG
jgi:tetrahydromethanopterin S-methyltransferase subunit A